MRDDELAFPLLDLESILQYIYSIESEAEILSKEKFDLHRHLSLSTNNIEKITNLNGLDNLAILSLGRNVIKKLENLEPLAASLQELWISYNALEKLVCSQPRD